MFKPKMQFWQAEYALKSQHLSGIRICSGVIYNLIQKIVNLALPSSQDKYEKTWRDFYLPIKRKGKLITIPLAIIKYKKDFFAIFNLLGTIEIKKGKEKLDKIYKIIFQEILHFSRFIKTENANFLKKTIPYDFRTGKIKGKYVLAKLISKKEAQKIWQDYQQHLQKDLKIHQVALNDYLKIASICYKSAYPKEANNLSALKMYKKWADNRDGGMLSIKNRNSKKEFKKLEIRVASNQLRLCSRFSQDDHTEHSLLYAPCKEDHGLYFKHIKWDEPRVVQWRK